MGSENSPSCKGTDKLSLLKVTGEGGRVQPEKMEVSSLPCTVTLEELTRAGASPAGYNAPAAPQPGTGRLIKHRTRVSPGTALGCL